MPSAEHLARCEVMTLRPLDRRLGDLLPTVATPQQRSYLMRSFDVGGGGLYGKQLFVARLRPMPGDGPPAELLGWVGPVGERETEVKAALLETRVDPEEDVGLLKGCGVVSSEFAADVEAEVAARAPPDWSLEREEGLRGRLDYRDREDARVFTIDKAETMDIGE
jgi:exoribonuclease R